MKLSMAQHSRTYYIFLQLQMDFLAQVLSWCLTIRTHYGGEIVLDRMKKLK